MKKYLYIDDENDDSIESLIRGFNDCNIIKVERLPLERGMDFSKLKDSIIEKINSGEFDGLLIDLRLDGEGPDRLDYSAISMTSELRAITARGDLQSFPIILCSTIEKIKETYNSDKTSHDLFDYTFRKSSTPNFEKFSKKLNSLALGYDFLKEGKSLEDVFGRKDLGLLDSRIFERFHSQKVTVPYDYAHFSIKTLFHCTNPLIKEKVFAARLGVDIEKSGESWVQLRDSLFNEAKYTGIFNNGWDRWWADSVNNIFKDLSEKKLNFLPAEERVDILKQVSKIENLIPATPIRHNVSSEFWTICEGHKKPLDPLEGFKIRTSHDLKPWQESKYLSLDAILERIGIDRGLEPHYSELGRIEEIKKTLK